MSAGSMVQTVEDHIEHAGARVGTTAAGERAISWALSTSTAVLACASLLILIWNPRALWMALGIGLLAVGTRGLLALHRATPATGQVAAIRAGAAGAAPVANVGLGIAAIAVAPLLAFAVLWCTLFVIIGAAWLLHLVGLA